MLFIRNNGQLHKAMLLALAILLKLKWKESEGSKISSILRDATHPKLAKLCDILCHLFLKLVKVPRLKV